MKITFDTEADSIEDLKAVLNMVNSALQKRADGNNELPKSGNEIFNAGNFVEAPKPEQMMNGKYQQQQPQNAQAGGKTAGGGRVIPYKDMSCMMSNIFSNQSTRRTR